MFQTTLKAAAIAALLVCVFFTLSHAAADTPKPIAVPAGDLVTALQSISRQAGIELLFDKNQLKGVRTKGVSGTYTSEQAIRKLLEGTRFELSTDESTGAMMIGEVDLPVKTSAEGMTARMESVQMAQSEAVSMQKVMASEEGGKSESSRSPDRQPRDTPEILVKGKRSLNMDIKRTEDAAQPYVVFDAEEIQRSQAATVEDFLKTRLPMNTNQSSENQTGTASANNRSTINLRGLGTNETLILVDGRRMPNVSFQGDFYQPDVNGIPIAMVERIEVLPSTAGGIYGGSATGGVINIILKRNYTGLDVRAMYANTFDSDAANRRLDLGAGFSLEGGRTHVTIAASHADSNALARGDRHFAERGIALLLANNPGTFFNAFSPPGGATPNIRSAAGDNLVLDGGVVLNSAITFVPLGYAGPASDAGAALVRNAGHYNLDLADDLNGRRGSILNNPVIKSISANLRREFGAHLEAFVDLSARSNRGRALSIAVPTAVFNLPGSAPNNPFQQAIHVSFPIPNLSTEVRSKSETTGFSAGIIARLPHAWVAELDYSWNRSRSQFETTTPVIDDAGLTSMRTGQPGSGGRPALNVLQESNTYPINFGSYLLPSPNQFTGPFDTNLKDATLRFSGPLFALSGGLLTLSGLIEHREEEARDAFDQRINSATVAPTYTFYPHRSQDADSFYLEARVPLVSDTNALPFMHELELRASIRRDEYETASVPFSANVSVPSRGGPFPSLTYTTTQLESTDYMFGVRYSPIEDLALRASYGTGFLPPAITQITHSEIVINRSVEPDPKRGGLSGPFVGSQVPVAIATGGNPFLLPEQSESWSAGAIFTPRFMRGFRLSMDYTRIEKVDEIRGPGFRFMLANEDSFPGFVVRDPLSPADAALGYTGGPVTSIGGGLINITQTMVEACDIQADYTLETERSGSFHAYAIATRQTHYESRILPTSPVIDSIGFTDGPLEWRGNLGLDWSRGSWTTGWNAQYYHSYFIYSAGASPATIATNTQNQGSDTIPSQVYLDAFVTRRFNDGNPATGGLLANTEISFGIQNLFDKHPPIVYFNGYSMYGDPRLRRYTISLRKFFE